MTDTYAGVSASETLLIEPNFTKPGAGLGFARSRTLGVSTIAATEERTGVSLYTSRHAWLTKDKEEAFDLLEFWKGRMARVRSFWMPSWLEDFAPSGGTGTSQDYLDVETKGFERLLSVMEDLTNEPYTRPDRTPQWGVLVVLANGDRHVRLIEDYTLQSGTEYRISFVAASGSENLPDDLSPEDIHLISLVRRVRFVAPTLDIRAYTDGVLEIRAGVQEALLEA